MRLWASTVCHMNITTVRAVCNIDSELANSPNSIPIGRHRSQKPSRPNPQYGCVKPFYISPNSLSFPAFWRVNSESPSLLIIKTMMHPFGMIACLLSQYNLFMIAFFTGYRRHSEAIYVVYLLNDLLGHSKLLAIGTTDTRMIRDLSAMT